MFVLKSNSPILSIHCPLENQVCFLVIDESRFDCMLMFDFSPDASVHITILLCLEWWFSTELDSKCGFLHGPQGHNQIRHAGAQTVASQFPCCWLDHLYASVVCSLEFGKAQQRSVGRDTTTRNTKTGLTTQVGKLVLPTMTPFDFKSNLSVQCRHTPDNTLNKTLTEKSRPFHAKVLTLLYFSVPAKGW